MDTGHIVLGLVSLAGLAASVYLLYGRGQLLAQAAAAGAERERTDQELERALAGMERLRTESKESLEQAEGLVARLRDESHRLREELTRLNAEALAAQEQWRSERDAVSRQHRAELAGAEELYQDRLRSLAEQRAALEKRIEELNAETASRFSALAAQTLRASSESFLQLAEQKLTQQRQAGAADLEQRRVSIENLLKPIAETLAKTDQKIAEIEKDRAKSFGDLQSHLRTVSDTSSRLERETSRLVQALKKPDVRGRWGEVQLRRVVEVSGMRGYCDFTEQTSALTAEGRVQRPDMIVRLPNDRRIVVDAKANINAYVEALEAEDSDAREERMVRFATHVADQVSKLGAKAYWEQFDRAPEFVVMFVPGDQFVDAALSRRPGLVEEAATKRVILASPSTLIGLLQAVELGWREQRLAEAYDELRAEGATLHDRFRVALEHLDGLGTNLKRGVESYNKFVASYERNLEPTLKKFEDAGLKGARPLPELKVLDANPTNQALLPGVADARSDDVSDRT